MLEVDIPLADLDVAGRTVVEEDNTGGDLLGYGAVGAQDAPPAS